jgi:hypothetical protein
MLLGHGEKGSQTFSGKGAQGLHLGNFSDNNNGKQVPSSHRPAADMADPVIFHTAQSSAPQSDQVKNAPSLKKSQTRNLRCFLPLVFLCAFAQTGREKWPDHRCQTTTRGHRETFFKLQELRHVLSQTLLSLVHFDRQVVLIVRKQGLPLVLLRRRSLYYQVDKLYPSVPVAGL